MSSIWDDEQEHAKTRADLERAARAKADAEQAAIEALPLLKLEQIVAPAIPDLAIIDAYLTDASNFWVSLSNGRFALHPDDQGPLAVCPTLPPQMVRDKNDEIDMGQSLTVSMKAQSQVDRAHAAAVAGRPRAVKPPQAIRAYLEGPRGALARARIAFEDLRAALADGEPRLAKYTAQAAAEVERYHADVEQAKVEHAEKQRRIRKAESEAETKALRDAVDAEARRIALLEKAEKLGVR